MNLRVLRARRPLRLSNSSTYAPFAAMIASRAGGNRWMSCTMRSDVGHAVHVRRPHRARRALREAQRFANLGHRAASAIPPVLVRKAHLFVDDLDRRAPLALIGAPLLPRLRVLARVLARGSSAAKSRRRRSRTGAEEGSARSLRCASRRACRPGSLHPPLRFLPMPCLLGMLLLGARARA